MNTNHDDEDEKDPWRNAGAECRTSLWERVDRFAKKSGKKKKFLWQEAMERFLDEEEKKKRKG